MPHIFTVSFDFLGYFCRSFFYCFYLSRALACAKVNLLLWWILVLDLIGRFRGTPESCSLALREPRNYQKGHISNLLLCDLTRVWTSLAFRVPACSLTRSLVLEATVDSVSSNGVGSISFLKNYHFLSFFNYFFPSQNGRISILTYFGKDSSKKKKKLEKSFKGEIGYYFKSQILILRLISLLPNSFDFFWNVM